MLLTFAGATPSGEVQGPHIIPVPDWRICGEEAEAACFCPSVRDEGLRFRRASKVSVNCGSTVYGPLISTLA